MTHHLFRKPAMLTRTKDARRTPNARRLLGGNAWKTPARLFMAVLVALAIGAALQAADSSAGVVRVSDPGSPAPQGPPANAPQSAANAPAASTCPGSNACACDDCRKHNRCKDGECRRGLLGRSFGCLFREGCGWRFLDAHCYCMTYAVNPWYCDHRDGAVYAAYGYGAPMTVPLAPNVTNQYNYGWGVPSGRLTPISRVAPYPGAMTAAVAPY